MGHFDPKMGVPPKNGVRGGTFSKVIGKSKEWPPKRGHGTPPPGGVFFKSNRVFQGTPSPRGFDPQNEGYTPQNEVILTSMPKWGSECIYSAFLTKNDAFLKKSAFFSKKHAKFIVNHTIFGFWVCLQWKLAKNECVYSEKSKKHANSIENPFKMSENTVKTNKTEKIKQNEVRQAHLDIRPLTFFWQSKVFLSLNAFTSTHHTYVCVCWVNA